MTVPTRQVLTTLDSDTSGLVRINTLRWRVWKAHETLTRGIEQYETQPATPVIESSFDIETRVHTDLFSLDLDFIAESFPLVAADFKDQVAGYANLLNDALDIRAIPDGFDAALVALDDRLGEKYDSILSKMKSELKTKRDEAQVEFIYNVVALGIAVLLRAIVALLFVIADGWGRCGQAVRNLTRRSKRTVEGKHVEEPISPMSNEPQSPRDNSPKSPTTSRRSGIGFSRSAFGAAALALVVDACHGGNAVLIVQVTAGILNEVTTTDLPLLESAMQIEYIDPILTGSASRFVLSDATATEWVDRYDAIVADLDAAIAQQGETSSLPVDDLFNAYIDEKNTILVEKETIAISADADITQADRFDAMYGRTYLVAKSEYLVASNDYRVQQVQSVRAQLTSGIRVASILLMISSFLLALIVLGVLPEFIKDAIETCRWMRQNTMMKRLRAASKRLGNNMRGSIMGVRASIDFTGKPEGGEIDVEKGESKENQYQIPAPQLPLERKAEPQQQLPAPESPHDNEGVKEEQGEITPPQKDEMHQQEDDSPPHEAVLQSQEPTSLPEAFKSRNAGSQKLTGPPKNTYEDESIYSGEESEI
uniref:Uncharacterized protein n=1 Tax=Chromera velia CCMP2878 TaxID=1169474 RepID=A0A0G4FQX9_9ALVE|eukprot:Cvel_18293.t1-p1 / transcript=Cvel_18293.t1 / gene=Cvel_18293 / organism=Chromera_velia_CCMP2878 / gene_product=hypothetical protein / transcript_product=hypothetical protein / location=Cvel_scaffold1508:10728-14918(+) / protein_length=594 / sequence_SO=supercontig / SO=protein_coding / is_pseudo=false